MGLGELNIGGGGIGPISDKAIGGSGNSDSISCSSGLPLPLSAEDPYPPTVIHVCLFCNSITEKMDVLFV